MSKPCEQLARQGDAWNESTIPHGGPGMSRLEVTVGPAAASLTGSDHLALQSAVDYVASRGGGTVRVLPGTYRMGNSLYLRHGIRIVGAGESTVLYKGDAGSTPLTANVDWYEEEIRVRDPSIFRMGGGIWIEGESPFYPGKVQIAKRTVVAVEGDVIHLDRALRDDYWLDPGAEAGTAFPVITAEYVNDASVDSLAIEGNRERNPHLDDNYAGAVFIQDCDRIAFRNLTIRGYNSDGISAQICDDLLVDGCRIEDCADLGIHPGSGCQRPRMTNNTVRRCSQGIFFCWGVRCGLAEGNLIEDCFRYGISIGHRDTDNIIRGNTVRRSGEVGVLFRTDRGAGRSPDRCVVEGNRVEDSGMRGDGVAIDLTGVAEELVIRGNHLVDTRPADPGRRRIGIRIGPGVVRPVVERNEIQGMEEELADLRTVK
jgi:hypothetical protein